jgi:hypothetical protein
MRRRREVVADNKLPGLDAPAGVVWKVLSSDIARIADERGTTHCGFAWGALFRDCAIE